MISEDLLSDQIALSKADRKTTTFLRQLIFRIVHQSLVEVYGENYSIRCLQSSVAVKWLLSDFGIRSKVLVGAACFSRASRGNPYEVSWAGFWGDDHHVWVTTEFDEFVDLTIAQLHLHPASSYDTDEPIPAIWWHPASSWPPIMKYLPQGVLQPELPPEDAQELDRLVAKLPAVRRQVMASCGPADTLFGQILYGFDHLNEMTMAGHPWLVKSLQIQESGIALPEWVSSRELELRAQLASRS